METNEACKCCAYSYRFKSYYVVWKPHDCEREKMTERRFKSYYVVWKLIIILILGGEHSKFKSYYVVWKLWWCFFSNRLSLWFKSYYVVWKQECRFLVHNMHWRLNRTMQYGNFIMVASVGGVLSRFKSYYVVWKLLGVSRIFFHRRQFKSYYVVWKLL